EDESLHTVEVPGIAWRVLVVPLQLAGVGFDGENRANIKIVLAPRLAKLFRPWSSVAGSDINKVGIRIVGHAVPNRAAASELPPVARPCFGGRFQSDVLERFRWIAGNRIKAPQVLAGVCVESREKSAHRVLAATDANDHFALRDSRRHRDRVV